MRARTVGLVFLAIVREAASACSVYPPTGNWKQGAVYQAVEAGAPNIAIPEKWEGFNRTVSVEGFCDNSVTTSSSFTCATEGGGSEFRASVAAPGSSAIKLTFGSATCPLTGFSVYKTDDVTGFPAELRLEFEGCTGVPATTSAAVVVGVRKDANPEADFGLLAWSKQVCKHQTTTTAAPQQVSQETDAISQRVGDGSCDGTERRRIENIATEDNCKLQCIGSATQAQILGGTGCVGFAFNAAASPPCITYSNSVMQAKADPGWTCYNMSYKATMIAKSTVAPPEVIKELPKELYMFEALGKSSVAYLRHITPPADSPTCFPTSHLWWFELEDREGRPLSVGVKETEWDEFMATIPKQEKTSSKVTAPMVLDRVIFNTCTKEGWSHETCFVAPAESDSPCRSEELEGAIISGVMTSILTWFLVGVVFQLFKISSRTSSKGPEYERIGGSAGMLCAGPVIPVLCFVAAGGSCLCCWLSMQFLEAVFRSTGCYNFDEFLVVILCVVIAVALSILILLLYMHTVAPYHPHEIKPPKKDISAKSHLMVLEVEEGKEVGEFMPTLVPQGVGGSAMASFQSGSPIVTPNASFNAPGGPQVVPGAAK